MQSLAHGFRNIGWKTKRFFTNLGYKLRFFRAPSARAVRPSLQFITLAVIAVATFILAGGIYDILERPASILPRARSGYTFIAQGSINIQTLNESLLAALLYVMGLSSLYMLLRSTRYAYRPRNAYLLLILGTFTSIIAVWYSLTLIDAKVKTG